MASVWLALSYIIFGWHFYCLLFREMVIHLLRTSSNNQLIARATSFLLCPFFSETSSRRLCHFCAFSVFLSRLHVMKRRVDEKTADLWRLRYQRLLSDLRKSASPPCFYFRTPRRFAPFPFPSFPFFFSLFLFPFSFPPLTRYV